MNLEWRAHEMALNRHSPRISDCPHEADVKPNREFSTCFKRTTVMPRKRRRDGEIVNEPRHAELDLGDGDRWPALAGASP